MELDERTRVDPVPESDTVVVGAAAKVEDDTEDDKADDGDDLDGCEDELAFTVDAGTEQVDDHDHDETHRDPDGVVHGVDPEVDQDGRGDEFRRKNDYPVVPCEHNESDDAIS